MPLSIQAGDYPLDPLILAGLFEIKLIIIETIKRFSCVWLFITQKSNNLNILVRKRNVIIKSNYVKYVR